MSRRKAPVISAEARAVLDVWQPAGLDAEDAAVWFAVAAAVVRVWVAAAAPDTVWAARNLLWATARLAIWAYRTLGSLDAEVVWHPHNVTHFVSYVCAGRSRRWRQSARSALQRMGRAVNPGGWWPPVLPEVGRAAVAVPYSPPDENLFALDAVMPGRAHRAARMWTVAGAFGAGLTGPALAAASPRDLIEMRGGRLATRVAGTRSRIVPVRDAYTEMVRDAAQDCGRGRFIAGTARNVHHVAERLGPGDSGLVLRRARSTWLAAHIRAGTPLAALRIIAGPVGAQTLDGLVAHVGADLSAQDAVVLGLDA